MVSFPTLPSLAYDVLSSLNLWLYSLRTLQGLGKGFELARRLCASPPHSPFAFPGT